MMPRKPLFEEESRSLITSVFNGESLEFSAVRIIFKDAFHNRKFLKNIRVRDIQYWLV